LLTQQNLLGKVGKFARLYCHYDNIHTRIFEPSF
jgi:hypothetical protein